MKCEELFSAIGELDGRFVEEAASAPKFSSKKQMIIRLGALVACLMLAVSAAYLHSLNRPEISYDGTVGSEHDVFPLTDNETCLELSIEKAYEYEPLGELLPRKWVDGRALSECFPDKTALVAERQQNIPESRTVMKLILDSPAIKTAITLIVSDENYFEEFMSADGFEYDRVYSHGNGGSQIYVKSGGYVIEYFTERGDLADIDGLFDMIYSAECFAETDEPEADLETPKSSQAVSLNYVENLDVASALISLSGEDYAAMTYGEMTEYFGIAPSVDKVLPYLTRTEGNYGVYRTDVRGIYYDGNAICFESEDGTRRLNVGFSKVFRHVYDYFDLISDELVFTDINGREPAIFCCTDENGRSRLHAEFLIGSVAVYADAENIPYEDFVSCLKELVGESGQSAGGEHTVTGTVNTVDSYANHIGIIVDKGGEKLSYGICLPDGISAGDYSMGSTVTVTFKGEPATVLTVWKEQLISIETKG